MNWKEVIKDMRAESEAHMQLSERTTIMGSDDQITRHRLLAMLLDDLANALEAGLEV